MKIVCDFGGVVLNWQPVDLLQQVLPQRASHAEQGRAWATAIFQGFHPSSDWALFDQGGIAPAPLAQRMAAVPPQLPPCDRQRPTASTSTPT